MNGCVEQVATFGAGHPLVGVCCEPTEKNGEVARPTVLLLNAGFMPRVGPNRLYVDLARQLARRGFPSLRFDFSGIGDSPFADESLGLEALRACEIGWAMDYLAETYGAEAFAALGLCLGADAAFDATITDPRISATVLLNTNRIGPPPTAEVETRVKEQTRSRYYRARLLRKESWKRLLTGRSNLAAVGQTLLEVMRGGRRRLPRGSLL